MKKIKLFTLLLLTSITFTSCDFDEVAQSLRLGIELYGEYDKIASRGPALKVTELNKPTFESTRSSASSFLNEIQKMNYISYPGVGTDFRDEMINTLKEDINSKNLKQYACTDNQCVYSYKDKALIIANVNGDNLDAMTLKGNFTPQMIESAIKSGDIFKIKDFLK